ncbi:CpaF family protein [Symbiobacterium terraclitae]|uniref:CpaF family protein n=1 Tax=Symbiobacterium terraclitae TaxID=557451 RepID=UPI0035B56500
MQAISLSAEAHRRKTQAGRGRGVTPGPPSAPAVDGLVYQVTDRILSDHADVVHAVAARQRDPETLRLIVADVVRKAGLGPGRDLSETVTLVLDNILRYGVLQPLVDDPDITDIFVNGPDSVWVRRHDRDEPRPDIVWRDAAHLTQYIRAVLSRIGARITAAECLADGRDVRHHLRINAGIPPAAPVPYLALRKHVVANWTEEDFLARGTFTSEILTFLRAAFRARLNIVISGPTGSGKTTLLRFLANTCIPRDERIVVLEEEAELAIRHPNQVQLEAHRADGEDDRDVTLLDLVRNALRMAPRRIILGELRGKEAFALLRAMGTGHDGGLTTVHANDVANTIDQLAVMMLFAETPLTYEHLTMLASDAVDLIVYVENQRISQIAWLDGWDPASRRPRLVPLVETCRSPDGRLTYHHHPVPQGLRDLLWRRGVRLDG